MKAYGESDQWLGAFVNITAAVLNGVERISLAYSGLDELLVRLDLLGEFSAAKLVQKSFGLQPFRRACGIEKVPVAGP